MQGKNISPSTTVFVFFVVECQLSKENHHHVISHGAQQSAKEISSKSFSSTFSVWIVVIVAMIMLVVSVYVVYVVCVCQKPSVRVGLTPTM